MKKEAELKPNYDEFNHVFKIICGAGHHSVGRRGVLKYRVQELLERLGYEHYFYESDGVLLVRFKVMPKKYK